MAQIKSCDDFIFITNRKIDERELCNVIINKKYIYDIKELDNGIIDIMLCYPGMRCDNIRVNYSIQDFWEHLNK